jgi:probable phosphoglycerate mutase
MPGRAPGLHLSAIGQEQAQRAADRLASLSSAPSAIYSSPIERTKETAAPIARALGLRVRTHPGLLDCAVGDWEGKSLKVLARRPEWRTVQGWPTGFRFPGGESFPETLDRVVGTVLSLAKEHEGGRLVCVSHADPIKLFLSAAMGLPLDMFQRFTVSPGSISAVVITDARPVVLCINSTGSLAELVPS